jgi:hypothetical protein
MRALPVLFLVACADTPDAGLTVDAHLQATTCEGAPCTDVDIQIFRDGSLVRDTSVWLSLDGEPSIEVPFVDPRHHLVVPQWVSRAQIDVTAGDDVISVEGANRLTSPFEMAAALPETVTVGSIPHLTWRAQGGSVRATSVFASRTPTRIGFVEVEGSDDGDLAIEDVFTIAGEYTIGLYRSVEHHGILWGSNWQQRVNAIVDPK